MNTTAIVGIVAFALVVWLAPGERRTGSALFRPAVILASGIVIAAVIVLSKLH